MLSTIALAQKLYEAVERTAHVLDTFATLSDYDREMYVGIVHAMCAYKSQHATPEQMAYAGHEMLRKHRPSTSPWAEVRAAWIDFAKQLSDELGTVL